MWIFFYYNIHNIFWRHHRIQSHLWFTYTGLVVKKISISAKLTNRFPYMFCFLQDFSKHLGKSKNADLEKKDFY
jgi:hypothetical protein